MTAYNSNTKAKRGTRVIVYTALFVALLAALAQLSIPLAFSPVPLTLGLFAVLVAGTLLGEKLGTLAVIIYILLGLIGLPVFASFRSTAALFGPTGGYIVGYIPAAFIAGFAARIVKDNAKREVKVKLIRTAMFLILLAFAVAVCYLLGTIWFSVYANVAFISALNLCVFPFIPLDLVKVALTVILTLRLKRYIKIG